MIYSIYLILHLLCVYSLKSKLLLLSFDGFRYDYLDLAVKHGINISGFKNFLNSGLQSFRLINEFATRTGPNHMSMVTGLHEESHGIVDNVFYDPVLNDTFDMSSDEKAHESKWFDVGSEPIWVTNKRHGYKSVALWPGTFAKIMNITPDFYYPHYIHNLSFVDRVDYVVEKLQEDFVTMGLLYYHEPDQQGHLTGPDSPELFKIIGELSLGVDYLLSKINSVPSLKSCLNIIITSDHGMSRINNTVILNSYISDQMYFSPGPEHRVVWLLWPKNGKLFIYLFSV